MMNCLLRGSLSQCVVLTKQKSSLVTSLTSVRWASSGGNKNLTQAPGKYHGVKRGDGTYVFPGEFLVARQRRPWFHPGLNVTIARKNMHLIALKEGVVRITCEKPDLMWSHTWCQNFYPGREGQTFYKKYFNVIPVPQHARFKCIGQI